MARITTADPDDRMPPVSSGKKLTPDQVALLRRRIAQGAPYAKEWAYDKPGRPAVPEVRNKKWARNPVDRFILARLEREKLKPALPADRHLLPAIAVVSFFFRARMRGAYRGIRQWIARLNAFLQERVTGLTVVQLLRRDDNRLHVRDDFPDTR